SLNRIVTMYLDYAEDQAERKNPMYMKDWEKKLDAFLQFNEREIINNAGKISHQVAKKLAEDEYEKYNKNRLDYEVKDDFDIYIEENELKY
ncbi:MAG: RhuM family protein, partial [Bacillota bacterium]|nr:RhuM family protein [Bacillota bacterium]